MSRPHLHTAFAATALVFSVAAQDPTPKVLVIGIDGLRADAMAAAQTPNIDALIANGCYSDNAHAEDLTFSGPNWASILHGVHRDRHNVTSNLYAGNSLASYPDFLAWLENHQPSWTTVRITTWDAIYLFQPTGADIDLFSNYVTGGDAIGTQWAAQLLLGTHPQYPGRDVDALFMYLAGPDVVGHSYGFDPRVPEYLAEIEVVDAHVGSLVAALQARPGYANEDWIVVLTSDHGGSITGSHSGNTREKRRVPFLVSGPSAAPGTPFPAPRNLDVSKTVLTHMGAPIPASLDGHVVGLATTSPPALGFDRNLIFNGDAEFDRGFDGFLPDQHVSGWDDPGPDQTTVIRWGVSGGWPTLATPGPSNRGQNLFTGNNTIGSRMTQTIELAPAAPLIDAGTVSYELSAWLGGFSSQNDRASVSVYFLDARGELLGADTIGPVTNIDRANQTALLFRASTGNGVPPLARTAVIAMDTVHDAGGGTDGYADNLSFVLRSSPGAQPARPARHVPTAGTTEWRFTGSTGVNIDSVFGPGTLEYGDGLNGATRANDTFGTSDGVTIPHIDGQPVSYMYFKRRATTDEGYKCRVGVPTSGDYGIRQFTMIMDVFLETSNTDNFLGIWNGNATNSNDSEFFLRPVHEGYWVTNAGIRDGVWRRGRWNRIAFVNDYDGEGVCHVYCNGHPVRELQDQAADYVADGDPNPFWFLTDDTPSETSEGFIAHFAFVDALLDPAEVGVLGGPSSGGIFDDHVSWYGCGVNPAGSLTLVAGTPTLGGQFTLGVDNPTGAQQPGSTALLLLSSSASLSYPCGSLVPGWHMAGIGAGEFLLSQSSTLLVALGNMWTGPAQPVPFAMTVPNTTSIMGQSVFVQGVMFDPSSASVGLAEAVRLSW